MQSNKVTSGELAFYEKIKNGEVRAILGKTDKGEGWRPVCKGRYLGAACVSTERQAIRHGKIFIAELKRRVDTANKPSINEMVCCDVCGDFSSCRDRGICRFVDENPPVTMQKPKGRRKSKAVIQ